MRWGMIASAVLIGGVFAIGLSLAGHPIPVVLCACLVPLLGSLGLSKPAATARRVAPDTDEDVDQDLARRDSVALSMRHHRLHHRYAMVAIDYFLQRSVFEVSAGLVDCVDETDARNRFAAAIGHYWSSSQVDLLIWERGRWRQVGDTNPDADPVAAPDLSKPVILPRIEGEDLIIDLSPAVSGQAALVVREARRQPSLLNPVHADELVLADVLRGQLTLALRRVDLYAELQRLGRVDPLTGTWRRWYGQERLQEIIDDGHVVAVAMVDIDHFKKVNDTYGHAGGDVVLEAVGRVLSNSIRTGDLAYRYGGEEFVVVLPETSPSGSDLVGQRLRAAVAALSDLPSTVTVSVGVASCRRNDSVTSLIKRADAALYQAKEAGRNRVINADVDTAPEQLRQTVLVGRSDKATTASLKPPTDDEPR